jgi:hypothetical protein
MRRIKDRSKVLEQMSVSGKAGMDSSMHLPAMHGYGIKSRRPSPTIDGLPEAARYPKETRNPHLPDSTPDLESSYAAACLGQSKAEPKIKLKVALHRHHALAALLRAARFLLRELVFLIKSFRITTSLGFLVFLWRRPVH